MAQEGIVRKPVSVAGASADAPLWINYILANAAAYGDFVSDMVRGMQRCNELIADFLEKDNLAAANRMLGKREALKEMRHMVDAYRKSAMGEEEK